MKAFYSDYRKGDHIPSDNPAELDFANARRVLNTIRQEGSFLGVLLPDNDVLQLYQEKESLCTVELVHADRKVIEAVKVNMPMAERALEAAFVGEDVKTALSGLFLKWEEKSF